MSLDTTKRTLKGRGSMEHLDGTIKKLVADMRLIVDKDDADFEITIQFKKKERVWEKQNEQK